MPIRVSADRVALYGGALFLICLWQLVRNTLHDPSLADWTDFWSAGATVGTHALLDPRLHFAFETSHGFGNGIWPYLPAFAWLFVPAAHLSPLLTWVANALVMLAIAAIAGVILSDVFLMPRWFGVLAVLAWPPVKVAALGGQNTPLALLLVAIAIYAAQKRSPLLLGTAIGLLLYKPSLAAPFLVLLILRREWRAVLVVATCAAGWYLASVPASGGDWAWPKLYADVLRANYAADFASNAANAVSLPGVLMRFGMPVMVSIAVGLAVFVACLPRLITIGNVEALSVTSVLAVAVSPHAWSYEPVILLPGIFYAMRAVAAPSLTWFVVAAYIIADASLVQIRGLPLNLLAGVVLAWAAFSMAIMYAWQPARAPTPHRLADPH